MTSTSEFYYSLLRISILQMLKIQGFDRSKASTVNAITDLYVKFLELLLDEVTKMSRTRQQFDDTIALQDITQAFQNLGIIKPVDILDVYDENPELPSDLGLQNFKDWWMDSDMRQEECLVSLPSTDLINVENINGNCKNNKSNNGKSTSQQGSLIPDYINQIQNNDSDKNDKTNEDEDVLLEDLVNNGDFDNWIRFIIAKQRLNLSKKLSKEKVQNIDELPAIPGFKNSILETMLNGSSNTDFHSSISNSDLLPSNQDIENSEEVPEYVQKWLKLLQRLPIMMPETRLDNITLSYEENIEEDEADDNKSDQYVTNGAENATQQKNSHTFDQADEFQLENDNFEEKNEPSVGSFSLESHYSSEYKEIDDMDNSFQRESIDFTTGGFDQF